MTEKIHRQKEQFPTYVSFCSWKKKSAKTSDNQYFYVTKSNAFGVNKSCTSSAKTKALLHQKQIKQNVLQNSWKLCTVHKSLLALWTCVTGMLSLAATSEAKFWSHELLNRPTDGILLNLPSNMRLESLLMDAGWRGISAKNALFDEWQRILND